MISVGWLKKKKFYLLAGFVCMIPVIWIARTSFFYFCYLPIILAAFLLSGKSFTQNKPEIPSVIIRISGFILGMIICEFLYSIVLLTVGELFFSDKSFQDWQIILIEMLLAIIVFLFFIGIFSGGRFIFQRIRNTSHPKNKGENH